MLSTKFNMDFESTTEAANPVSVVSNDFMSDIYEMSLEACILSNDISDIEYQHEMMAIEAYREANGDSEAIESELNIIREASEKSIWQRVKDFLKSVLEKLKAMWAKFKNWIVGIFTSNDKLIKKFKGKRGEIHGEFYEIDKNCIANLQNIANAKMEDDKKATFNKLYFEMELLTTGYQKNPRIVEAIKATKVEDMRKAVYAATIAEKKERTLKIEDCVEMLEKSKALYKVLNEIYLKSETLINKFISLFKDEEKVDPIVKHGSILCVTMVNTSVRALNIAVSESRRALMSYKEEAK